MAFGGFIEELQTEIGFRIQCFGNHQQTGRIFIDTVHKPTGRWHRGNICTMCQTMVDGRTVIIPVPGCTTNPPAY